jgi:hypothetical protein
MKLRRLRSLSRRRRLMRRMRLRKLENSGTDRPLKEKLRNLQLMAGASPGSLWRS